MLAPSAFADPIDYLYRTETEGRITSLEDILSDPANDNTLLKVCFVQMQTLYISNKYISLKDYMNSHSITIMHKNNSWYK